MKIKIVKKATNMKPSAYCGYWMDDPPMNNAFAAPKYSSPGK